MVMANYYSWDIKHNLKGFHCQLMGITCLYKQNKQQIPPLKGNIFNGHHNHKKKHSINNFLQAKKEEKNINENIKIYKNTLKLKEAKVKHNRLELQKCVTGRKD